MISLDQVLLLEEKVESAVAKIQQLEAENAALRNKCSELTNALSAKSEQLAAVESDQNKIESGIIKAIDRLNSIENTVLKAAGHTAASGLAAAAEKAAAAEPVKQAEPAAEPVPEEPAPEVTQMDFDSMDTVEEAAEEPVEETVEEPIDEPIEETVDEPVDEGDGEAADNLGFDIF